MVALYHQPYNDNAEYADEYRIGTSIAADLAVTLDETDTALVTLSGRLDQLGQRSYGQWETIADARATITHARALIEQMQRVVDPHAFYDEEGS